MRLDRDCQQRLIRGASVLATGGGIAYDAQMRRLSELDHGAIDLLACADFRDDEWLLTILEIGEANAPFQGERDLAGLVSFWEEKTGRVAGGFYASEIGQEILLLEAALQTGRPIADFDAAGGRAVPLCDIVTFTALGLPYSYAPCAIMAGAARDFIAAGDIQDFEKEMRQRTTGGVVLMAGAAMQAGAVKGSMADNRSLSHALALADDGAPAALRDRLQCRRALTGKVVCVEPGRHDGFLCAHAEFLDDEKRKYTLFVMNELLSIRSEDGTLLAAPPDNILILDEREMRGLSSSELLAGAVCSLMITPPNPLWLSDAGQKLFGRARMESFEGLLP